MVGYSDAGDTHGYLLNLALALLKARVFLVDDVKLSATTYKLVLGASLFE